MGFVLFYLIVMCPLIAILWYFVAESSTVGPFRPDEDSADEHDEC